MPVSRHDGLELYFLSPTGAMMAAPIAVTGATLEPGAVVTLFQTGIVGVVVQPARPRSRRLRVGRNSTMALLDWSQCPAVESIPGKVSGAWVFRGTRTPVAIVFENLEDGMSIDEVMEQFPVTREQVKAVLEFTARSLDVPA